MRTLTTLTQSDGSFLLDALQEGDYQFHVSQEGFALYQREVHIPSQASLEIHLVPGELTQSVNVSASSGYIDPVSSVATKIPMNLLDVPQDVQTINRTIIDQGLDFQLAEVAKTVSGVSPSVSGSGYLGNVFAIRGFTLSTANSYLRDGLKFGTYSFSDLADVEEVQVMKGPASVLYGESEPGGVINLVSKRPTDAPFVSLQFTGGNGDFLRPEFDISGPLLRNQVLSYRVNGIGVNTAIFSVVNTVLLKPFGFPDPERIVMFRNTFRSGLRTGSAAPAEFNWWRQHTNAFQDISAYEFNVANLTGEFFPQQIPTMRVSADFFQLCGGEFPVSVRDAV